MRPDGQQAEERIQRYHAVSSYIFQLGHGMLTPKPTNRSFDLCDLQGASQAFFPGTRLAMYGTYQEVPCSLWKGSDGYPIWNGSCMADTNAAFWPTPACGNEGNVRPLNAP